MVTLAFAAGMAKGLSGGLRELRQQQLEQRQQAMQADSLKLERDRMDALIQQARKQEERLSREGEDEAAARKRSLELDEARTAAIIRNYQNQEDRLSRAQETDEELARKRLRLDRRKTRALIRGNEKQESRSIEALELDRKRINSLIEQGASEQSRLERSMELSEAKLKIDRLEVLASTITPQMQVAARRNPNGPEARQIEKVSSEIARTRESLNLGAAGTMGAVNEVQSSSLPPSTGSEAQGEVQGEVTGDSPPMQASPDQGLGEIELARLSIPGISKWIVGNKIVVPDKAMASSIRSQLQELGINAPVQSEEDMTEKSLRTAATISFVMRDPSSPMRQRWESAGAVFNDDSGGLEELPSDPQKVGQLIESLVAGVGNDEDGLAGVSTFVQQEVLPLILSDPSARSQMFTEDRAGELGGLGLPGVRPNVFAFGPQSTMVLNELSERDPKGFIQSGYQLLPMTPQSFFASSEKEARRLTEMSRFTDVTGDLSKEGDPVQRARLEPSRPPGFENKKAVFTAESSGIGRQIRRANLIMQSEFQRLFEPIPAGEMTEDERKALTSYIHQFSSIKGYIPDQVEYRMTVESEALLEDLSRKPLGPDIQLSEEEDALLERWIQESNDLRGGG